jgi:hypothetical protein
MIPRKVGRSVPTGLPAFDLTKKVDEMLQAIKEEGYFSSWILIEECTID